MTSLPASIEAYLLEAGFSSTEILILKRLLEGDALTLRELGSKTGKSTGVLDQATRKLLVKKILSREVINGTPKFTVSSLHAIAEWVESDMQSKRALMQRKHKDFETFLSTLELDKGRPEMEYYEGREGIEQAFTKLLERGDTWLCYSPATVKEEEDPLREFRVQLFRQRRSRKIFARVIAPDTALGKRFASRDVFEYRETKLIPEDQLPVGFEKIIVGDTIACFNHAENKACFIRYGEMADSQRKLFEMLWCMGSGKSEEECVISGVPAVPAVASLETKTLSGLREFFLSRKSLVTMGLLAVLSSVITFGLYQQNLYLNKERVREKVRAIAATAAATFKVEDINALHDSSDMDRKEYKRVVEQLDYIRGQNPGVKYVYIVRPIDNSMFEFVADADGLRVGQGIDFNGDGLLGVEDEIPVPGMPYDVSEIPGIIYGMKEAVSMDESFTDQWGTFISGFAPIRSPSGETIAVLGIDQLAEDVNTLTKDSFVVVYWLAGLFVLFMMVRLAAFNKSLFKEIVATLRQQSVLFTLCLTLGLASIITYALYMHTSSLNLERIREKVAAIAATSALQFRGEDIDLIRNAEHVGTPVYEAIVRKLMQIQQENRDVAFAYILRQSDKPDVYTFVAANDGLDPSRPFDADGDGKITEADEISVPGDKYDVRAMDALQKGSISSPIANQNSYTDQWGTFLTAYAPIVRDDGSIAGLFSVDVRIEKLKELNHATFKPFVFFFVFFAAFMFVRLAGFHRSLMADILRLSRSKKVLVTLGACAVLALCITYGLYWYTLNLMKEEVGNRLMAIATTAASQIDANDLEPLRSAMDMKRPEYQSVFEKLNEIRKNIPETTSVYILRPSSNLKKYEWIVDADSNFDIPYLYDFNNDGIVNEADEGTFPGRFYDISSFKEFKNVDLHQSFFSQEFQTDQWGVFLTGYAPIKNSLNEVVGLLCVDLSLQNFNKKMQQTIVSTYIFFGFLILLIVLRLCFSK